MPSLGFIRVRTIQGNIGGVSRRGIIKTWAINCFGGHVREILKFRDFHSDLFLIFKGLSLAHCFGQSQFRHGYVRLNWQLLVTGFGLDETVVYFGGDKDGYRALRLIRLKPQLQVKHHLG